MLAPATSRSGRGACCTVGRRHAHVRSVCADLGRPVRAEAPAAGPTSQRAGPAPDLANRFRPTVPGIRQRPQGAISSSVVSLRPPHTEAALDDRAGAVYRRTVPVSGRRPAVLFDRSGVAPSPPLNSAATRVCRSPMWLGGRPPRRPPEGPISSIDAGHAVESHDAPTNAADECSVSGMFVKKNLASGLI